LLAAAQGASLAYVVTPFSCLPRACGGGSVPLGPASFRLRAGRESSQWDIAAQSWLNIVDGVVARAASLP
jgi:hypothetical protein